jgi:hypothetical protein
MGAMCIIAANRNSKASTAITTPMQMQAREARAKARVPR